MTLELNFNDHCILKTMNGDQSYAIKGGTKFFEPAPVQHGKQ